MKESASKNNKDTNKENSNKDTKDSTETFVIMDKNREGWLTEVAKRIEPTFSTKVTLQPYRVTCGWPCKNALGTRNIRVGECHSSKSSKAGYHEIFISPLLEDPLQVAGTICHELVHVAAGTAAGHGKKFVAFANFIGLTKGKPTNMSPGELLESKLKLLLELVGPYPHLGMAPEARLVNRVRTSVSLQCITCECKVTMSTKWLLKVGPPKCACGSIFKEAESKLDKGR